MKNTYQIKISYRKNLSLHKITSLIESVKGVRIKQLNLISKGKSFVGVLALEVTQMIDLDSVVALIRSTRDVSNVEKVNPNKFSVSGDYYYSL
ncbi:hypothetical protein ACFP1I_16240 [Dyadobacter subterraneus]|uniref:ACT domain-containing protein n=1 Tax=Dyadobacter subterraneus TaxID=2773304 RepID=A0ABR9WI77_9BACT|nr:hypothetical protein [Dyadobacter subterraneus]MBE9465093.1 hypothetical protein [Dyadobacter subterraneus]